MYSKSRKFFENLVLVLIVVGLFSGIYYVFFNINFKFNMDISSYYKSFSKQIDSLWENTRFAQTKPKEINSTIVINDTNKTITKTTIRNNISYIKYDKENINIQVEKQKNEQNIHSIEKEVIDKKEEIAKEKFKKEKIEQEKERLKKQKRIEEKKQKEKIKQERIKQERIKQERIKKEKIKQEKNKKASKIIEPPTKKVISTNNLSVVRLFLDTTTNKIINNINQLEQYNIDNVYANIRITVLKDGSTEQLELLNGDKNYFRYIKSSILNSFPVIIDERIKDQFPRYFRQKIQN